MGSDCECRAHELQNCSWWCGQGLTPQEIAERENPVAAQLVKLTTAVNELTKVVKSIKTNLGKESK